MVGGSGRQSQSMRRPGSNYSQWTSKNSGRRSAVVTLWVVNASPVILLARVGQLDLLRQLGSAVVIPEAAVLEIRRRGPTDPAVQALAHATGLVCGGPVCRGRGRPCFLRAWQHQGGGTRFEPGGSGAGGSRLRHANHRQLDKCKSRTAAGAALAAR